MKGRQDGAWRRLSRPPRSWCARGQSPLALLSIGPWRLKAGQRCKALRGAGSSSGRPLQAVCRLSRSQRRPNRRWRTRTSLRSPATGGCMARRAIRIPAKCRGTHPRLSSTHRWLNTINLVAARRSPVAGGHGSCPHPCTRTSSRASSDFILCRYAPDARALPPSAPADRALTIHCLCLGGYIERRRFRAPQRLAFVSTVESAHDLWRF